MIYDCKRKCFVLKITKQNSVTSIILESLVCSWCSPLKHSIYKFPYTQCKLFMNMCQYISLNTHLHL